MKPGALVTQTNFPSFDGSEALIAVAAVAAVAAETAAAAASAAGALVTPRFASVVAPTFDTPAKKSCCRRRQRWW